VFKSLNLFDVLFWLTMFILMPLLNNSVLAADFKKLQTLPQDVQMQTPAAAPVVVQQPTQVQPVSPSALPASKLPSVPVNGGKPIKLPSQNKVIIDTVKPPRDLTGLVECATDSKPVIQSTSGVLKVGTSVTINGSCFGQATGEMFVLYGANCVAGVALIAPSKTISWTNSRIVIQLQPNQIRTPPDGHLADVPACEVKLYGKRATDKAETNLFNAQYVP
jgi:hypothetical protein